MDFDLSPEEAANLIAAEKHRRDERSYCFPPRGGFLDVPLISPISHDRFTLDINRRGHKTTAYLTYLNRTRGSIILIRLDLSGPIHYNNPGRIPIPCPHIHYYQPSYESRLAHPVPSMSFRDLSDPWQTLQDFIVKCNITLPPFIAKGGNI